MALRELALRRTAERVDDQMRSYRRDHGIAKTWPASERLLVCVGPNPASIRLIRAARRMAAGLRAEWVAVYVETPLHPRLPDADREALERNLRLAEDLGARTAILSGHVVSEEVLAYARAHNVTKIVAGKPTHPRWRDRLRGSLVDEFVRGSGDIDVYVISGDDTDDEPPAATRGARARLRAYARAAAVVGACTALSGVMSAHFATPNLVMVYLLGVAFVATRYASGPAVLASVLSVAVVRFLLRAPAPDLRRRGHAVCPHLRDHAGRGPPDQHADHRVREQAETARQRERRTATLFALSRTWPHPRGADALLEVAVQHIAEIFESQVVALMPDETGTLQIRPATNRTSS